MVLSSSSHPEFPTTTYTHRITHPAEQSLHRYCRPNRVGLMSDELPMAAVHMDGVFPFPSYRLPAAQRRDVHDRRAVSLGEIIVCVLRFERAEGDRRLCVWQT